jgi:pimeloyl-ACP methyl ester carboxylesterase
MNYSSLYDSTATRFATASDGCRVAYKRLPALKPGTGVPLILVSGFSRLKREWAEFGYQLCADRDLIVIDNRGLDESVLAEDQLDSITTHHRFAEDVLSVAATERLTEFHLAGVSMGGYIAQYLLLRLCPRSRYFQPEWAGKGLHLLSVTLICCAPKRPFKASTTSPLFKLLDKETEKAQIELDAGRIDSTEFHFRIQFESWKLSLTPEWVDENPDKVKELVDSEVREVTAGRKPDAVLKRHREAGNGFDVMDELKRIEEGDRIKVLVVHGDKDALVPHTLGADLFKELMPWARYVLFEDVGHSTYLMDNGATASAMNAFLAEIDEAK